MCFNNRGLLEKVLKALDLFADLQEGHRERRLAVGNFLLQIVTRPKTTKKYY